MFKNNVKNTSDIEDKHFSEKFINLFKIQAENTLKLSV
jgi:hypothetical protein